ncbi:unnamed protein product [Owenia fusiformis]|uniref:Beta-lactamase-related domain-containing protein n=1 Tax=Owenia fusiformis TaxID=6347 RepID=A0A8S4PVT4_OWEFU|nr:unnamed protein product [Owenia fusiformis]
MLVLLLGISQAQTDWPQIKDKIDKFVNEILECRGKVGMNLAIVQDGETQYTTGYGYADLENQVPNDGETVHFVYSISKSMCVTLFAQLIEETGISWDSLVVDLLPNFRFRDEERNKAIKLRDLLGGSSGFPEVLPAHFDTKEKFLEIIQCTEPVMTTRESFCYVDKNYFLAGMILEHLTGKSYTELVNERIFAPLNMNTSFPSQEKRYDDSVSKWAYGHALIDGQIVTDRRPGSEEDAASAFYYYDFTVGLSDADTLIGPAYGAMSTAEDMAEYVKFHLGVYRNDGSTNPVVDPAILREMYKPDQAIDFLTSFLEVDGLDDVQETWRIYDYGMGFWMGNYKDTDIAQHGGYGPHNTILTLFENWNIGIYTSITGPNRLQGHATMALIHFYIADILRGNTPIYDIEYACEYTLPDKYGAYCGPFNIFPEYSIDKSKKSTSPIETYIGTYVKGDEEVEIKIGRTTADLMMKKGCEKYILYPSGVANAFVAQSTGECYGCAKSVVFTSVSESGSSSSEGFSTLSIDGVKFRNSEMSSERECD